MYIQTELAALYQTNMKIIIGNKFPIGDFWNTQFEVFLHQILDIELA